MTLSHRFDEDDHQAVQIVIMDLEEEHPVIENFLLAEPIQIEG
jgi:hypothetical protein